MKLERDTTVPKRLRWSRRDWSGAHGLGQSRRDRNEVNLVAEKDKKLSPKVGDEWGDTYNTPESDIQPVSYGWDRTSQDVVLFN